jgi:hypothetical protein
MRAYVRACGLTLGANRPIPGLTAELPDAGADVQVEFDAMPPAVAEAAVGGDHATVASGTDEGTCPEPVTWGSEGGHGFQLLYDDVTRFVVSACGSRVWATWPDALTLEDTAVYLLGPVLAFVLRLRGMTCLHASAICVEGAAVVLAGPSGSGKSTTAAAFADRGYAVVTDDLLALEVRAGSVYAHPGCPRLRLWPESVEILYGPHRELPLLTPNWEKRYLDLGGRRGALVREPRILSAIYFLDARSSDPAAPFIAPLAPSAGLLNLLANIRGEVHPDNDSQGREFALLGRIARDVPIRRVVPSKDAGLLDNMCDVVLADIRSLRGDVADVQESSCTI